MRARHKLHRIVVLLRFIYRLDRVMTCMLVFFALRESYVAVLFSVLFYLYTMLFFNLLWSLHITVIYPLY